MLRARAAEHIKTHHDGSATLTTLEATYTKPKAVAPWTAPFESRPKSSNIRVKICHGAAKLIPPSFGKLSPSGQYYKNPNTKQSCKRRTGRKLTNLQDMATEVETAITASTEMIPTQSPPEKPEDNLPSEATTYTPLPPKTSPFADLQQELNLSDTDSSDED
jgi:hypothetical protein